MRDVVHPLIAAPGTVEDTVSPRAGVSVIAPTYTATFWRGYLGRRGAGTWKSRSIGIAVLGKTFVEKGDTHLAPLLPHR